MTRRVLVTGGAGFIGSNLARALLREGAEVRILDNLSRAGSEHNLLALQRDGAVGLLHGDVRDRDVVGEAVDGVDEIYHLAAQVAVTSSVIDPRSDLETNLLGTFNVLEVARRSPRRPFLLYTSTNKVYGDLTRLPIIERESAYAFEDRRAIDERELLDLHSPYGCSKGAAEQYVRDYARVYGLPTVVFRMSCIAGPHQFGNEDQGWLAHFIYSVMDGIPITIYGDGKQVRDVLHVSDLIDAMLAARQHRECVVGQIFNIGGGVKNAFSLRQVMPVISAATGGNPDCIYRATRVGDQKIFVTDHARFTAITGWQPKREIASTIADIVDWRNQNPQIFSHPGTLAALGAGN